MKFFSFFFVSILGLLTSCGGTPNDPWPQTKGKDNTLYSAFSQRLRYLDPARNYSHDGNLFIAQIYESPLQYHFLKRPYKLIPQALQTMPEHQYFDAEGNALPEDTSDDNIARTDYVLHFRADLKYQPHPALAKNTDGAYLYHQLSAQDLKKIHTLGDFAKTGTRTAVAADFAYQIKRLATPWVNSPISSVMASHIVGFEEYATARQTDTEKPITFKDKVLRETEMSGVKVVDDQTLVISVIGKYPRFLNWLAMGFFTAMPWEADVFYHQPGMEERNIVLNWYPIGTGPYMLTENNPNLRMVLERNPNFHPEFFPSAEGLSGIKPELLKDVGKPLPQVDRIVFGLEREAIPLWSKFLQGYYDMAGVGGDVFDKVISIDERGKPQLTDEMSRRGIKLDLDSGTDLIFYGFNMLDTVVGGDSERARFLRRAISIAIDEESYVAVLMNGQGIPAQGPIPPGLFGYLEGEAGINPYVYRWENGQPMRRDIQEAKDLMVKAGYPNGKNPETGKPLVIHFLFSSSAAQAHSYVSWMTQQFAKLGIELQFDSVDWNRYQEAIGNGSAQLFSYIWNADYPDPENFLFLFHSQEGKVKFGGENATNYSNPEFDKLYRQIIKMDNSPQRHELIQKMVKILRADAPMVWGIHSRTLALSHQWVGNTLQDGVIDNGLKYRTIDADKRLALRHDWNQPVWWPVWMFIGWLAMMIIPGGFILYKRSKKRALS